ncbi:MAG: universal stress protein [Rubellimicrobium sp.]|nr:universal stress protein [Rubellimicrobium sp.]
MAYKTISLIATNAATDGAALRAALAIAQREEAHLEVFCVGIDPAHYDALSVGAIAVTVEIAITEARNRAASLAAWVAGIVPPGTPRVSVQEIVSPQLGLDFTVSRVARYSDLVVAARPYGPGRDATQVTLVEAALFATGAPVLIVPDDERDWSRPFGRVMVAWNESDVSFAAIRAAMPILKAADHVDLVMVDPPSHSPERSDPGGAVSLMLARHGIRCEVSILARTLPKVSEIILRFARDHGAEAIVMGAYGHSRFREAILGGATREMLEGAQLPLLMAH